MMSVLFQREPEDFWQAEPRERPLWALVVALAVLALFVAALCAMSVSARTAEETGPICSQKHCYCDAKGCLGAPDQATLDGMIAARAGQLTTNEPIAVPCTGCILVDGKWVQTAPPGLHRTRCLPVGSDQIVDCWVEDKR